MLASSISMVLFGSLGALPMWHSERPHRRRAPGVVRDHHFVALVWPALWIVVSRPEDKELLRAAWSGVDFIRREARVCVGAT
jgi:hypothetical protein